VTWHPTALERGRWESRDKLWTELIASAPQAHNTEVACEREKKGERGRKMTKVNDKRNLTKASSKSASNSMRRIEGYGPSLVVVIRHACCGSCSLFFLVQARYGSCVVRAKLGVSVYDLSAKFWTVILLCRSKIIHAFWVQISQLINEEVKFWTINIYNKKSILRSPF
jgi:hypothetical protein